MSVRPTGDYLFCETLHLDTLVLDYAYRGCVQTSPPRLTPAAAWAERDSGVWWFTCCMDPVESGQDEEEDQMAEECFVVTIAPPVVLANLLPIQVRNGQ